MGSEGPGGLDVVTWVITGLVALWAGAMAAAIFAGTGYGLAFGAGAAVVAAVGLVALWKHDDRVNQRARERRRRERRDRPR